MKNAKKTFRKKFLFIHKWFKLFAIVKFHIFIGRKFVSKLDLSLLFDVLLVVKLNIKVPISGFLLRNYL